MERVAALNDESSWWNLAFEEGERNWEKEKSEVVEWFPGIWENTENSGKAQNWSISESSPKILKNSKYYIKIFGEIGFQKFNPIFKIKILEFTVNGVYTG